MATTIVTKNGTGAPTDSDLVAGELAVDLTNGRLYTEDSGGTVLELGTNPASDVTFGDNTKAIFGAGSDLQIYHDASDSIINDNGTGSLKLQQGGSTKLEVTATGVDVTGTVTADGLTLQTSEDVISWASGNGIVQAPSNLYVRSSGTGDVILQSDSKQIAKFEHGGDISFYEDTGTTAKFFWDADAESLSIGAPSADNVTIYSTDDVPRLEFEQGGTVYADVGHRGASAGARQNIFEITTKQAEPIAFRTNNTERMRIDSSGNVGINGASGGATLQVNQATASYIDIKSDNALRMRMYGDSNQAILVSEGVPLIFKYGTTEAMRIANTGQVLVGSSTSPASGEVKQTLARAGSSYLEFQNTSANTGSTIGTSGENFIVYTNSGALGAETYTERMRIDASGGIRAATGSRFLAASTGEATPDYSFTSDGSMGMYRVPGSLCFSTGGTERMRIDSSGNLLVGTTSSSNTPSQGIALMQNTSVGSIGIGHANGTSSGNGYMNFAYNGGAIGSVTQSGTTAVLYNTSSDQRLKENIADADDAGSKVDAIQVRKFDWKSDGSHQDYGMVAQELQTVAPEAVSGDADSEEMMGVDYSKLVPMLVKEIQSLRARVAALES